jgi:hypothetical protein
MGMDGKNEELREFLESTYYKLSNSWFRIVFKCGLFFLKAI